MFMPTINMHHVEGNLVSKLTGPFYFFLNYTGDRSHCVPLTFKLKMEYTTRVTGVNNKITSGYFTPCQSNSSSRLIYSYSMKGGSLSKSLLTDL